MTVFSLPQQMKEGLSQKSVNERRGGYQPPVR